MIDLWCTVHKEERDFTFFSARHLTQSRIDMMLVSNGLQEDMSEIQLGSRTISDHTPVSINWHIGSRPARAQDWHLNNWLLEVKEVTDKIPEEITTFLPGTRALRP